MPGPTTLDEIRARREARLKPSPASAGGWMPSILGEDSRRQIDETGDFISRAATAYRRRANEMRGGIRRLTWAAGDVLENMKTPDGFNASVSGFREGVGDTLSGMKDDILGAATSIFDPGVSQVVGEAIRPKRTMAQRVGSLGFDATMLAAPLLAKPARQVTRSVVDATQDAARRVPGAVRSGVSNAADLASEATTAVKNSRMFAPKPKTSDFQIETNMAVPDPRPIDVPTMPRGAPAPLGGNFPFTPVSSSYSSPGRVRLGLPEAAGNATPPWSMGPSASSSTNPTPFRPNFYGGGPGLPTELPDGPRLGTVEAFSPQPASAGMGRRPGPQQTPATAAFEALVPDRYKTDVTPTGLAESFQETPPTSGLRSMNARGTLQGPPGTKSVAQMVAEHGVEETARRTGMSIAEVKAGRILDKEPKVTVRVKPRNPPPAPQPKPKPVVAKAPAQVTPTPVVAPEATTSRVTPAPGGRVVSSSRPLAAANDDAVTRQAAKGNKLALRELALREQEAAGTFTQQLEASAPPKPVPNPTPKAERLAQYQAMVDAGEAMDIADARTIMARAREQPRRMSVADRLRDDTGAVGPGTSRLMRQRKVELDELAQRKSDPNSGDMWYRKEQKAHELNKADEERDLLRGKYSLDPTINAGRRQAESFAAQVDKAGASAAFDSDAGLTDPRRPEWAKIDSPTRNRQNNAQRNLQRQMFMEDSPLGREMEERGRGQVGATRRTGLWGDERGAVGRDIGSGGKVPGNEPDTDFDFLDGGGRSVGDKLRRLYTDETGAIRFKNVKEEDYYEAWRRLQKALPGEVHEGFARNLLSEHDVDPNRPGLQKADPDEPYYKQVVYRDPRGKPIIVAELSKTREGDWGVASFGADPELKGSPMMGKAMHKLTVHLMDDLGVRGPSTSISGDTRNYITKLVTRGTGKTVEELNAMFPPPPPRQRGSSYPPVRNPAMHPGVSPEMAGRFQESIDTQNPTDAAIARLRRQLDAAGLQSITDDDLRQMVTRARGEGNPMDYGLNPQPSRSRGNLTPAEHERHARVTRLEGELNNAELNETRRMESRERAIAEGRDPSIYGPPDRRERALQRLRAELDEARNPNRFDEPTQDRWDVDNPDAPEPYPGPREGERPPNPELADGEQSWDYERWIDEQARSDQARARAAQQQMERADAFIEAKNERDRAAAERRAGPSDETRQRGRTAGFLEDERGAVGPHIRSGPRGQGSGYQESIRRASVEGEVKTGGRARRLLDDETGAINIDWDKIRKGGARGLNELNALRMTMMLAGWKAPAKSVLGNFGAVNARALERGSLKPLKEFYSSQTARDWMDSFLSNQNPALTPGQNDTFMGKFNLPGRFMGAGDDASRKALMRSGDTEEIAKEALLTNYNAAPKALGLDTIGGKYVVPFTKTPSNTFAQGWKRPIKSPRHFMIGAGAAGAGYGAGTQTQDPSSISVMSAALGPYAGPFLLGALASAGPRAIQGFSPVPEWTLQQMFTENPMNQFIPQFLKTKKDPSNRDPVERAELRRSNKRKALERKMKGQK